MSDRTAADHRLLERHGRDTTSFQSLGPGLRLHRHGEIGFVAHRPTAGAWVAAGEPICAAADAAAVLQGFVAAAAAAGRRPVLFGVESGELPGLAMRLLKVGEQPVWDPAHWPAALAAKRSLREQLRRARAKGVRVRAVDTRELAPGSVLRGQVEVLVEHWLASRRMAPMGFVVHVDPFDLPAERRFLAAHREGELVGILVAVPIYARDGWLLEDVLRDPAAPNGTVELLFDSALRMLAEEGSRYVTFGLAPLARVEAPLLRLVRRCSRPLYDFDGLLRFKTKLHPDHWQPVYVAHPRSCSHLRALLDVLAAFAGRGGFVGFGWRTLVHRAPLVVRVLALLLLPWIALLTVAAPRWFPAPWVQWAWIAYDLLLFVLLWRLAGDWRPARVGVLRGLILLDFVLGGVQLLAWNLRRCPWFDAPALLLAQCAPLFAWLLLGAARDRRAALLRARRAAVG